MEEAHERTHGFGEIGIQRREVSAVRGFSRDLLLDVRLSMKLFVRDT